MPRYVVKTITGRLISWVPEDTDPAPPSLPLVAPADYLAARGMEVVTLPDALDETHRWDAATKSVVPMVAEPAPNVVTAARWVLRFSPEEFQGIRQSADARVQLLMYALDHSITIDLNDTLIKNGVAYLVAVGLISTVRAAKILE